MHETNNNTCENVFRKSHRPLREIVILSLQLVIFPNNCCFFRYGISVDSEYYWGGTKSYNQVLEVYFSEIKGVPGLSIGALIFNSRDNNPARGWGKL